MILLFFLSTNKHCVLLWHICCGGDTTSIFRELSVNSFFIASYTEEKIEIQRTSNLPKAHQWHRLDIQSPVLLAANDLITSADISSSLMRGFINVVIFEILLILITTLKREVLIINPFWDEQSENMGR